MAAVAEKELAVARVYAASLLELAASSGKLDVISEQLRDVVAYAGKQPEFSAFLTSPMVDASARGAAIEKLFRGRLEDALVSMLQVLNRKERLGLLSALGTVFGELGQERKGVVEVHVRSAAPLTDGARERLRQVTSDFTRKQAHLNEAVDESLVGGLIVRIGDQKFDLSVSSRLHRMYDAFLDRVVRESYAGRTFCEGAA